MATAAKASATRITNLPNGLTVATEENSSAGAATVGVWIDAGSRAESAKTNGAANLLEHIAIQVIYFFFGRVDIDTRKRDFYSVKEKCGEMAGLCIFFLYRLENSIGNCTVETK